MSSEKHILIVDDENYICEAVGEYLAAEGYRISTAHDGVTMRRLMAQSSVDLVLLDLRLPREDGLALACSLRGGSDVGIIIMTGRGETTDRIVGLEMGADDYVVKPVHLDELLVRIKNVLRRLSKRVSDRMTATASRVYFAGWCLDLITHDLLSPSGDSIRLTGCEFDLLATFIAEPNRLLTRDRLLDIARDRDGDRFDRTIDVRVARLRRKLADDPNKPAIIRTIRGAGYIFAATVEAGEQPAHSPGPWPSGRRDRLSTQSSPQQSRRLGGGSH